MRRGRTAAAAAAIVAGTLVAGACDSGSGHRAVAKETIGHARLAFSGAVAGSVDADVRVACSPPEKHGDSFTISIDSDGLPVGNTAFIGMDAAVPSYDGPRAYEVKPASGKDFTADDFFLLFRAMQQSPFGWGRDTSGTITIDGGETSGSLSLRRWRNRSGLEVSVQGTFRCGRRSPPR